LFRREAQIHRIVRDKFADQGKVGKQCLPGSRQQIQQETNVNSRYSVVAVYVGSDTVPIKDLSRDRSQIVVRHNPIAICVAGMSRSLLKIAVEYSGSW